MKNKLSELLREEEGQGMTEYGLIIALVAIAVIVALGSLSDGLNDIFGKATDTLTEAIE